MGREYRVADVDELEIGEMKEVKVEENKILLVRLEDGYRALGSSCPHKGAPLSEGHLEDQHLRCPWHQAVFDIDNGELIEPCSLDSIPRFKLRTSNDGLYLTLPEPVPDSLVPVMKAPNLALDSRVFAIIGTGAAGMAGAEALRQEGYQGRIVMVTREQDPPYDRTDLSKKYLSDPHADEPFIRSSGFYREHGIEIMLGHEVRELDVILREIKFSNGSKLPFDRCLLATGSTPRSLGVPGESLGNVFRLRSYADCRDLRSVIGDASRAVAVGSGFLGMEVAASLAARGVSMTVVSPDSYPLERALGKDIGHMYREVHEEHGVEFRLGRKIDRFEGDGEVDTVILDDGSLLETELVIIAIGVSPNTGYMRGVDLNGDGSISVDRHMRVCPDIYAAGDIAQFPDWRTGSGIRIEHWRLALQLGRLAARNMAGNDREYADVPFFWTMQYDVNTKYVGFCREWDDIIYDGDPDQRDFLALYVRNGGVEAAAGCSRTLALCKIAELLRESRKPPVEEVMKLGANE